MSFLSALGKIGGIVGGIAAAPFTGGASLIPSLISAGGAAASAAAGAQANNRGQQASFDLQSQDAFERELMAREMNQRANRNDALKQSVLSSMLSNYHPSARPAGMPQSPFSLGQTGTDALNFEAQDALKRLQAGDTLPPLQRVTAPKAGMLEKILSIAGPAASIYGAAAGSMPHNTGVMPPSIGGPLQGTNGAPNAAQMYGFGMPRVSLQDLLNAHQTTGNLGRLV
jgi:hypothetical protein